MVEALVTRTGAAGSLTSMTRKPPVRVCEVGVRPIQGHRSGGATDARDRVIPLAEQGRSAGIGHVEDVEPAGAGGVIKGLAVFGERRPEPVLDVGSHWRGRRGRGDIEDVQVGRDVRDEGKVIPNGHTVDIGIAERPCAGFGGGGGDGDIENAQAFS